MLVIRLWWLSWFVCFSAAGWAQQSATQSTTPPPRDAQAVAVLNQAAAIAGGIAPISTVLDFTATGDITYYWAGQEVQGTVLLKGRGDSQLSLQATMPQGVRTVVISGGVGSINEVDGYVRKISNAINLASLAFPASHLVTVLQDNTSSVAYIGLETANGRQVHHVRIQKFPSTDNSVNAALINLGTRDLYVDATTLQITSTVDYARPEGQLSLSLAHVVQFSDYRTVNGVQVPFSITQFGSGQRTSSIQLNQITFNTGLTDGDFHVTN